MNSIKISFARICFCAYASCFVSLACRSLQIREIRVQLKKLFKH